MSPDRDRVETDTEDDPARSGNSPESQATPAGEGGAPAPAADPGEEQAEAPLASRRDSHNMLPGRERRGSGVERLFVRLIATCGIVGIGVAIAAIMGSSNSQGWLVGLVVSIVSVVLAAVLWSSRQL